MHRLPDLGNFKQQSINYAHEAFQVSYIIDNLGCRKYLSYIRKIFYRDASYGVIFFVSIRNDCVDAFVRDVKNAISESDGKVAIRNFCGQQWNNWIFSRENLTFIELPNRLRIREK